MSNVKVTLPDGSVKEVPAGTTIQAVVESIGPRLAKAALAAHLDGQEVDLSRPITQDAALKVITEGTPEGLEVIRHSTSHLMAAAVKELYPDTQVTIGPAIETGFYYDFARDVPFAIEDLVKIEEKMLEIQSADHRYIRSEIPKEQAVEIFTKMGENYKVEIIKGIPAPIVSIYQTGPFVDLCTGPHVPSTKRLGKFKLLTVAGAYWRGDEKNPMLQRIYGTAFFSQKDLDEHLRRLEEAHKRDHRRLGKELDLFSVQEEAGPGLIFWHPKGAMVRKIIEDFWREEHLRRGYQLVYTPHIAKADLWKTSGHLSFYKENMYGALEVEGQDYLLKPMNCPGHILIYKTHKRSYRELPIRLGELGTVYRYERSGVLHGMLRVRGFTQDDAHIFCTEDQVLGEVEGALDLALFMLKTFGFEDYDVMLSTGPGAEPWSEEDASHFAGTPAEWATAEQALQAVLGRRGLTWTTDVRGAAFYGPKIDISMRDSLGRKWQGPTIQFDFNLPRRFKAAYIGSDGKEHLVYMVHRAVLGSFERFMGTLVEHYAGAFPLWLAPEQVRLLPIADRHHAFAEETRSLLTAAGTRVHVDDRNEKVGFKIRESQMEKIPYTAVIGDKETEGRMLTVRARGSQDQVPVPLDEFAARIAGEIAKRR